MIEELMEADTPQKMRAELIRFSQYDNLTSVCFRFADVHGLSAEDRYTVLAYHATRARMELLKELHKELHNIPPLIKTAFLRAVDEEK